MLESELRLLPSSRCITEPSSLGGIVEETTDRVRKRSRHLVRLLISFKPRRSASLIRSFKLALRILRNRSSAAATSSSSVKVVLTHQDIR